MHETVDTLFIGLEHGEFVGKCIGGLSDNLETSLVEEDESCSKDCIVLNQS